MTVSFAFGGYKGVGQTMKFLLKTPGKIGTADDITFQSKNATFQSPGG
jgi:hypothetical protein